MAELKSSAILEIKDYAKGSRRYWSFDSDELADLRHDALQFTHWEATFFKDGLRGNGFAQFKLRCDFHEEDANSVWADAKATLLNPNGDFVGTPTLLDVYGNSAGAYEKGFVEFTGSGRRIPNVAILFKVDDLSHAVNHDDGSLRIRIDLTVLKMSELLKCRTLLCGLLATKTHTDFDVKVGDESFKLHKSILAGTSGVFARMFESGMEEAADGALTLPDTTPAAFKAFTEAIYFHNWNFLSDVDITQDVL